VNRMTDNASYWHKACHFFSKTEYGQTSGSYFIHNKNRKILKIGIKPKAIIYFDDGAFCRIDNSKKTSKVLRPDKAFFKTAGNLLEAGVPYFFIASPDLNRNYADENLPKMVLVQPSLEFTFSPDQSDGYVSYAQTSQMEEYGRDLLRETLRKGVPSSVDYSGKLLEFSKTAVNWAPDEPDSNFLNRLSDAITILQEFPDGKMMLVRSYEYALREKNDPFKLYEIFAGLSGDYACSHFFCDRNNVFSLGCSPENVFEICGGKLLIDAVASTCKSSDGKRLAREFYDNPKQIKEHKLSLNRRINRFGAFCKNGAIDLDGYMQAKKLRHVYHLHSTLHGELLPNTTAFDLLEAFFPPLATYPRELTRYADTETSPHRYYGGVVGHSDCTTTGCFMNIRNALLKDNRLYAKVGVGVIKESAPDDELQETKNKISGLMEATYLWDKQRSLKG